MPGTARFGRLAIASLALNAGLIAGLIALLFFANRQDTPPATARTFAPHEPTGETSHAPHGPPSSAHDAGAMDWRDGLRRSDAPRHVFVAAIQADFHERWNQRDVALQKRYTDGEIEIEDLALFHLDREIALEAAMREALGEDAFREWDRARKFADINTTELALDHDEAHALHAIRTALTERLRALERSKLKKEIDPATYEDLHENARADYERELRDLVGYQRYDQARDSGIPAYLRRDLRALDVSPDQLFKIQEIEGSFGDAKADLEYEAGAGIIDSAKLDQEQQTLAHLRDEQLRQILGEPAYALYRKQQDPRYQTMIDFAKDWRLTDQNVEQVFQLLLAHETETRRVQLAAYAAQIPPAETRGHISELHARLNTSLLQTLTPEQAESLRRNGILPLDP